MRAHIAINVVISIIRHAPFDANVIVNVVFGMFVRMKKEEQRLVVLPRF